MQLIEEDRRPLSVRIDCGYVVNGFNEHRHRHRARAWMRRPLDAAPIPNADLWRRADAAARRRAAEGLITEVKWVRGHPIRRHVIVGETTPFDAFGNVSVDALAAQGCRLALAGR